MNTEKTGKLISELRKERNLTQTELADLLYVSDKAVSKWETGRGFPDINSLEKISEVLNISIPELLKGERIEKDLSMEEASEMSQDSIALFREIMKKKQVKDILLGFLLGAVILTLLVLHMTSPIYFRGAEGTLRLDALNDGKIVAVLSKEVAGYETELVEEPDLKAKSLFISCYTTRWYQLFGRRQENVVILNEEILPDYIWYYPGAEGDELLFSNRDFVDFGVETLPRLIYNGWIVLGAVASVIALLACHLLRRKVSAVLLRRVAAVPVTFTLSVLLVMISKADAVYDAVFYASGIGLIMILLYAIFLLAEKKIWER